MKQKLIGIERRDFLKFGSLAVASIAIASRGAKAAAQGAPVDEKDPTAQAVGYKADATKVDKAKFKQYAPGQTCGNCQLYQGKPSDAMGGCPIFSGKLVNAKGWCSAYVKKV